MKLFCQQLHPNAKLPTRASEHAAGYDLYSVEEALLKPGDFKLFKTGIAIALPEGTAGQIWPRSGFAYKYALDRLGGLIDADYRVVRDDRTDEVGVILQNHGKKDFSVAVGDRIAQIVIVPILTPEAEWADELPPLGNDRLGGFGSSGK